MAEEPVYNRHNGYGISALILGIIGMVFIWVPLFPMVLGVLALILGAIGYWKVERPDGFGLAGFILGLLIIVIGFIYIVALGAAT